MITNFLPKKNEIIEQSIMFNESLRGFGFRCKVLIPESVELPEIGYAADRSYNEKDAFYAYISIDPHPSYKLLKNLGWDTESDDTKPMICYISRYVQTINKPRQANDMSNIKEIKPQQYTRLVLDYSYDDDTKEFIVTKVSANTFNPVYYIMNIVPYRPEVTPNISPLQDNNTEYINIQSPDNRFIKPREKEVSNKY